MTPFQYGEPDGKSQGASNPEYVNARVRARRAVLFDDDDYRKLIRMGIGEIARFMEETEYQREMNALGARYDGVDLIEYALNRNLAKHFRDLLDWAEGDLYELIAAYLRKFDAWNAKTAIRGVYSEADPEDVRDDMIAAGEFDEAFLDQLVAAESVEGVVELIRPTIFGDHLDDAFEVFRETDVLVPLENAIDMAFYGHLFDGLRGARATEARQLYREFLEADVDFRNARNALRVARSGGSIDPDEYYIDGGVLFDRSDLVNLADDPAALADHIAESGRYGDRLSAALADLREADSLIGFERALETALMEYADRLANVNPLAVTSVLAYILAKEREVDNIRAIARGREVGLTEQEIEEEVVTI